MTTNAESHRSLLIDKFVYVQVVTPIILLHMLDDAVIQKYFNAISTIIAISNPICNYLLQDK